MMRGVLISAVLTFCLPAVEAASHRFVLHPNSLTILSIAEGPDGFLWLAASDGLYRFDGFHYHKITSFPFATARYVAFTGDGSLWCGGLEGLARLRKDGFQVILKDELQGLTAYPDRLFVGTTELSEVRLDGSVHRLKKVSLRDLNIDSAGRLWFVAKGPTRACWMDPERPGAMESINLPIGTEFQDVVADPQGRIWAATDELAVRIENGQPALKLHRQAASETRRQGPLLAGRQGQLWFVGETVRGLSSAIVFQDRADYDRYRPVSGFEDRRGHFWVASLGQGLVEWIPEPQWQRWFPEDLGNAPAVQVVRDRAGSVVVSTHKNLYRRAAAGDKWSPLAPGEHRYDGLLPLEDGGFLVSIREFGVARLSSTGRVMERLKDLVTGTEQYREIVRDARGRIWVATKRALLRVEGEAGSLHLRSEELPEIGAGENVDGVDLESDAAGRLWAGYTAGIAWLDDENRWHKIRTDLPVTMVRSIALAGDDIWVAHRRAGAFSRLHRSGEQWTVTRFSANAGYGPVDTHFLKRDSRGWIWRGSPEGVHVSDGRHVAPQDWVHIHLGNGLATNQTDQYGFFEDSDGSVWIAGSEGVTHFRPSDSWFAAPRDALPPRVTRVEADGRKFLFPEPVPPALPKATRILRIDLGTLDASPFRDYPLRYRLLPHSKNWEVTRDGTLEFRDVPDGAYTLEAGYAGSGPSAVSTYAFRVGAAPGVLESGAWWRWMLVVLIAAGALVWMSRRASWFERATFRMERAIFLLRRRYSRRQFHSSGGAGPGMQDHSGEIISGRYHLDRIVCQGGFSAVYEARDARDGTTRLAVKVLHRISGQESWLRDRFAHEVAALRSLEHPGVVRILDSWISPAGEPCLAMPYLEGPTLRAALAQSPFNPARVARIVSRLGAALSEVHERGIVHRDLKPENIILLWPGTDREQPVIIDFGTAGMRSAQGELAATTLMAGSFHYMAPERLTGRYSPESDMYSLAVMVLEMLTRKRLADLSATFLDASFASELEKTTKAALGKVSAVAVAALLLPAFNPEPRRRPSDIKSWAEEVAQGLRCQG